MKILNAANLKKTYYYFKRNGLKRTMGAALERVQMPYFAGYSYQPLPEAVLAEQRQTSWEKPVTFSIVVPAYETKPEFMRILLTSLREQTYPHWELILADASHTDVVKKEAASCDDSRIRYHKLAENGGISENTNAGIALASGDYIGLLDHDDYLTADALYEMAAAIESGRREGKDYGFLYSNEDKCDEEGKEFYAPHFKVDFNLDLFLTNNYVCHFLVMKRELMQELKLRPAYDGAQDFDLCLRALSKLWKETPRVEERICHVPVVLYHWRCHKDSTAANPRSKSYAYDAGRRAVKAFVKEQGWGAEVEEMAHVGFYRIRYAGGIFAQRKDIAAIGGKELVKGRIIGSIYDGNGTPLYEGLPGIYSGYIHRAALTRDAEQLDITLWKINPALKEKIETFLTSEASKQYKTKEERQKAVCEYLRSEGYRLYWDPELSGSRKQLSELLRPDNEV